jgi:hypothetical protein
MQVGFRHLANRYDIALAQPLRVESMIGTVPPNRCTPVLSTARYRIGAVTQVLENLAMRGDITTDSVILSDQGVAAGLRTGTADDEAG